MSTTTEYNLLIAFALTAINVELGTLLFLTDSDWFVPWALILFFFWPTPFWFVYQRTRSPVKPLPVSSFDRQFLRALGILVVVLLIAIFAIPMIGD